MTILAVLYRKDHLLATGTNTIRTISHGIWKHVRHVFILDVEDIITEYQEGGSQGTLYTEMTAASERYAGGRESPNAGSRQPLGAPAGFDDRIAWEVKTRQPTVGRV